MTCSLQHRLKYLLYLMIAGILFWNGEGMSNEAVNPKLKHRMGMVVVRAKPGVVVSVRQLGHEFWFGTAVTGHVLSKQFAPSDKEKYLTVLKDNFNSAVHENALKWYSTEKSQGVINYQVADDWLKWCSENGLKMRGHCVYWAVDKFVQDWIKNLDNQSLRTALKERAFNLLIHYRGKIGEYDVNNEMVHGEFYAKRLGDSVRKDMFLWCHKADPDAVLYVNDYGILTGKDLPKYEKQIETLLAQGTPIGGIGLQGHFANQVDPEKVKKVLDTLSRFNLPIKITEFDMKTLDEDAKAKGLENLYRACFEHPSVNGILMWGFWSKTHWLSTKQYGIEGYTALWDKDWNPMPAALAYRNLVFNEWWTRFEGKTDENGICEIPVFLGKHQVTVGSRQMTVELKKAGERKEIILPEPIGLLQNK